MKSSEEYTCKDEKEHSRAIYTRQPMEETVHVHVFRIHLKGGYSLVTVYIINKRRNPANIAEAIMFQVEMRFGILLLT